jgi:hypothetical protein
MTDTSLQAALDRLAARWLVGGEAPGAADVPAEWRDAIDADDESGLLALATQARQFLLRPALPSSARPGDPLPVPALALLPDPLRLRFRRLRSTLAPPSLVGVLAMLATRGCMAHPFDWRPGPDLDDLPAAYDAWRAWEAAQRAPRAAPTAEADDWDAWSPSERRRWLAQARAEAPDIARERLAGSLSGLSAEHRLPLVETLAIGLGADDLPLLTTLAKDRSEKVRQAAARLRARLGERQPLADEEAAEVRGWFEVGRTGLIQRRTKVALTPLKTRPQHAARRARLAQLGWSDLCVLLGLSAEALADAWVAGDEDDPVVFECAAHTAPDAVALSLLHRVLSGALALPITADGQNAIEAGFARLSPAARAGVIREQLGQPGPFDSFAALQSLVPGPVDGIDLPMLRRSPRWGAYEKALQRHLADGGGAQDGFAQETAALAALLPHAAADALWRTLLSAGVHPGDPALDALWLNVQSPPAAAHASIPSGEASP